MRLKRLSGWAAAGIAVFIVFLAAAPPALKAAHLSWPPWLVAGMAAALIMMSGVIQPVVEAWVQAWVKRPIQQIEKKQRALYVLEEVSGRATLLPRVCDVTDRALLGVHPAIPLPEADPALSQEFPSYVSRDVDADLDSWVGRHRVSGGFLLLVGSAAAGKTRTAYELVRRNLGDWRMFMPANAVQLAEYIQSTDDTDNLVVWLNEIQNFLGPDGITPALVRRILADKRPVVLVGTIWPDRYEEFTGESAESGIENRSRDAREILAMLADRKDLSPEFTATEYQRARDLADQDPRIAEAIQHDDGQTLAATLAGTPELIRRWTSPTNSYGAAVISAAVFARLCGHPELLPGTVLESLADCFLTGELRARAASGWFSDALEWARKPVRGNVAPLTPQSEAVGRIDGDQVSDVLVQQGAKNPRINTQLGSETNWYRLIECSSAHACAYIATTSLLRSGPSLVFEAATKKAAEAGHIPSICNMVGLMCEHGDVAAADDWLAKAAATNHPMALTNMGEILARRGEEARAEPMLRKAADMGFPPAMDELSDLLQKQGLVDEAENWLRKAAEATYPPSMNGLALRLRERGDKAEAEEWARKAAVMGYLDAVALLGVMLDERGEASEAEHWLLMGARFGHPIAMAHLGSVLLRRGDDTGAETWWRRSAYFGESRAMTYLGTLIKERGDVAEAENWWRKAVAHDSPLGAHNMGMLSYERGDITEAEGWWMKAANAGLADSILTLGALMNERDKPAEAEIWWRKGAETGDARSMIYLGAILQERGETVEAEAWCRKAANLGNVEAMEALGALLMDRGEEDEAESWWRKSAEAGSVVAIFSIGKMYQKRGDIPEAETWLRQAVDREYPYAMNNLALLLWKERDEIADAEALLRRAADMGNPPAISNLGLLLQERNQTTEAQFWMCKAIDAGHSGAMSNLGAYLLDRGELAEAEALLRKAADIGSAYGMYNLGELFFRRGEISEAESWRQRAIAAGNSGQNEWPEYTNDQSGS